MATKSKAIWSCIKDLRAGDPTAHGRCFDTGLAGRLTATTLETLVVDPTLYRDAAAGPNVQTLANDLFRAG